MSYQNKANMSPWHGSYGGWQVSTYNPWKYWRLKYTIVICKPKLAPGSVELSTQQFGTPLTQSSMTSHEYKSAVLQAKEHILAGDIFQIVVSQCFERRTFADPFEIYHALRVVNPSPYMTYLQVH
ncbi:putative anthranilate synthase [Helianthus anomalus]